jgi:urea transport system ATP-binding protein
VSVATADTPILRLSAVTKRFGGLVVLDGLSLSVRRGGVQCILGPNGCGKTTLFNVVTRALPLDGGDILLNGQSLVGLEAHQVSRLGMVRKFQVPGVYPELTVAENLEIPLAAGSGRYAPLRLMGFRPDRARRDRLLELCSLQHKASAKVAEIAHGEKQRLEIAMLLARDAELLLLDEPTAGMSAAETEAIARLVLRLRDEEKKSVLVIEHDMNFVKLLDCDVVVMLRGKIIAEGSYHEVRQHPLVIESYLGTRH